MEEFTKNSMILVDKGKYSKMEIKIRQLLENEQVKFLNDSGMIREFQSFQCTVHPNGLLTFAGKNCTDDRIMATAIALYSIKSNLGTYNIS